MNRMILAALVFATSLVQAQQAEKPVIRLVDPLRENNSTRSSKVFVSGSTCKSCALTINGTDVKVYSTGGFAHELKLIPGYNNVELVATQGKQQAVKKLSFQYVLPSPPDTVKTLDIVQIQTFPEGNLVLQPGDKIRFRVKGLTGCVVMVNNKLQLFEMPANPMPGIYQGEYTVSAADSFVTTKIPVTIKDSSGKAVTKLTQAQVSLAAEASPDLLVTRGRLAHLLFGLGDDRLGGAKIGYIDSLIPLQMTGKIGSLYRIKLSKYRTAYIPDDVVDFLPKGTFPPSSLTGNWRVYGDSVYDYVQVALTARLPYQSFQEVGPSRIVVDVFGATSNTNWITQLENTKAIKNVWYEQREDEVLRITIELQHSQHWGHTIYYNGSMLVIRVKQQPQQLSLNRLKIAVDAGHGGGNTGAGGPANSSEKMLALAVSLKLQRTLQQQGAFVTMTRTTERFVDNKERILFYRDSLPDLLISIHLNSSADPVNVGGTGVFYRYVGFRPLSRFIYQRMLELGLREYGNTGSFNFMLNSPTEYPNALVEMLFISNPAEEELIMDEKFQQQIADKIVAGIRDFLESCKEG
ncbi:N-acetylmuramoyl-L-alanine amidase [Terrimonas sp. NA20]|uniref:N-acetylmuramoyl-L-alanine amidase n=1 Tax=Terrimonas ginsenosidimutans TaxID=2908004 RepID=A0ABS9KX46_9BACT|nr:N-acetylmuramoyl-L-alanine amidase [Terrimonas ginsenosidimutans]MCG2616891.1 N-acetylmuramoyl-L-alanine amidase [Terrimonas ginsenosidimutans]